MSVSLVYVWLIFQSPREFKGRNTKKIAIFGLLE